MDSFFNRLDNLAYELFGVVLPGLVVSSFLALLWFALGPLIPYWSMDQLPQLTIRLMIDAMRAIPGAMQTVPLAMVLMVWYFCGHAMNWISKKKSKPESIRQQASRVWSFLKFRTQKPEESYDSKLKGLFESVSVEFSKSKKSLDWREFYPLAKSYIVNTGRHSLLSNYQNKYTLHRSITAAAAGLFWLTTLGMVAARGSYYLGASVFPNWLLLWCLLIGSVVVVWGFSATFLFYWKLWGDTIVTESYSSLFGPAIRPGHGTQKRPDSH